MSLLAAGSLALNFSRLLIKSLTSILENSLLVKGIKIEDNVIHPELHLLKLSQLCLIALVLVFQILLLLKQSWLLDFKIPDLLLIEFVLNIVEFLLTYYTHLMLLRLITHQPNLFFHLWQNLILVPLQLLFLNTHLFLLLHQILLNLPYLLPLSLYLCPLLFLHFGNLLDPFILHFLHLPESLIQDSDLHGHALLLLADNAPLFTHLPPVILHLRGPVFDPLALLIELLNLFLEPVLLLVEVIL